MSELTYEMLTEEEREKVERKFKPVLQKQLELSEMGRRYKDPETYVKALLTGGTSVGKDIIAAIAKDAGKEIKLAFAYPYFLRLLFKYRCANIDWSSFPWARALFEKAGVAEY